MYRTIEFASGSQGPLTTTEIYFWLLDFIPLIVAVGIYIPFWPGKFIGRDMVMQKGDSFEFKAKMHQMESTTSVPLYEHGGV